MPGSAVPEINFGRKRGVPITEERSGRAVEFIPTSLSGGFTSFWPRHLEFTPSFLLTGIPNASARTLWMELQEGFGIIKNSIDLNPGFLNISSRPGIRVRPIVSFVKAAFGQVIVKCS